MTGSTIRSPIRTASVLVAAGVLASSLASCTSGSASGDAPSTTVSAAASTPTAKIAAVTSDDLVTRVTAKLHQQKVPVDEGSVSCTGQLPAATGQSATCRFTTAGQPVNAVATVTEVKDETVAFDLVTTAQPVPRAVLERQVVDLLKQNGYGSADSGTCAGDLAAQVDQSQTCDLVLDGRTIQFQVSVLSLSGGVVSFGITTA